eukprot:SAG31_NODE_23223_length_508_cov_3.882641_2_plen_33_part_01
MYEASAAGRDAVHCTKFDTYRYKFNNCREVFPS